ELVAVKREPARSEPAKRPGPSDLWRLPQETAIQAGVLRGICGPFERCLAARSAAAADFLQGRATARQATERCVDTRRAAGAANAPELRGAAKPRTHFVSAGLRARTLTANRPPAR